MHLCVYLPPLCNTALVHQFFFSFILIMFKPVHTSFVNLNICVCVCLTGTISKKCCLYWFVDFNYRLVNRNSGFMDPNKQL